MSYSVSELTLVRATPAQARQTTTNVYPQWGAPRGIPTLEAFHSLWKELDDHKHPYARTKLTWALVPRANPDILLAHCEIYGRGAFVNVGNGLEERQSYIIASVFTPVENRRKGYARHMLRLLHYILAPREAMPPFPEAWGAPPENIGDAAFSVLYSDVGREYYKTCTLGEDLPGWVANESERRVYKVGEGSEAGDWEWLDIEGVRSLEVGAEELVRRGLGERAVAISPKNWLSCFPVRVAAVADAKGEDGSKTLKRCGVRIGDGWVTFTTAIQEGVKQLIVGTVVGVGLEEVAQIARSQGAEEIEVWNVDWEGEYRDVGDSHIPAIAVYGLGDVRWEKCER